MTDLLTLHKRYREQHMAMWKKSGYKDTSYILTTRRQTNFRPRGDVYVRLLSKEFKWETF